MFQKRHFRLLLIALAFEALDAWNTFTAEGANAPPLLETGEEIGADELRRRLHSIAKLESFTAHFRQKKFIRSMQFNLESEGDLTVIRRQKILWQITRPGALRVEIEKNIVRIISGPKENESIQTYSAGHSRLGGQGSLATSIGRLTAWLQLDADIIFAHYQLFDKAGVIHCKPREAEPNSFQSFKVTLTDGGGLKRIEIEERSLDNLTIDFEKPRKIL